MTNTEEDEWEYEYDETETENFYITLDLSNTPAVGLLNFTNDSNPGHPTRLQSRLRALNAYAGRKETVIPGADDPSNVQQLATMGQIQITGLHTSNPLVWYDGHLLSCKWASTIGTDLFFVKPSPEVDSPNHPLRSLPAVDLLAMSSAKLTTNVAVLRPRDHLFVQEHHNEAQPVDAMDVDIHPAAEEAHRPTIEVSQPPVEETPSAPMSFLERLNQAKAKRGEKSRLYVSKTSSGSRVVAKKAKTRPGNGDMSRAA
ncbi:hypothetical protein K505DRAFT_366968 [Melanomma pulvis-pyrius CBS 109.77]|uniref:Transcription factor TFIIIC triple barrel domain-containing protein n=1 Tax=Melanomma pulvis-pyrius CBS 109.77 TaxID=1314802 RepID=A0A6A6WVE8_9PLEO|nr:hypothetical protein K505DRAFT_366968 [Melanomma pulvis-pyrius CBS 109.77]